MIPWKPVKAFFSQHTLIQALLLFLLLLPVFPGVFLYGHVIAPGDILFQIPPWSAYAPDDFVSPRNRLMSDVVTAFYPYYAVSLEAWDTGEWPLWNPHELAGIPLLANAQSATVYPPRVLHYLFGLFLGGTLFILFKVWLCGMTAWICARGLRFSIPVSRFFSVAWMLASYNLIWCNWSLTDVAAWLPILFLGVEWILNGRYHAGSLLLASGGAMSLVAGHPETAFAMGLGAGIYFLVRLIWERRWGASLLLPVGWCAGGWSLALLLSAIQWIPLAEYLMLSYTFAERTGQDKTTWLPLGGMVSFWVPRFFGVFAEDNFWGHDNSNLHGMLYPGMAVWCAAALAFPASLHIREQRTRIFSLLFTTLFCILFAFRAPGLVWLHRLPVLSTMREVYYSAFALFALPVLAAYGIEYYMHSASRKRDILWSVGLLFIVALFILTLVLFHAKLMNMLDVRSYVYMQILVAGTMAVLSLAALICMYKKNRKYLAAFMLTGILATDLIWANRGLNPTMPAAQVFPDTELTERLLALPYPTRVSVGEANIASGLMAVYGIEEWLGYDGLYPARIIRFQKEMGQDLWKTMEPACAIEYYAHDPQYEPLFPLDDPGRFELEGVYDGIELYRNRAALPRARLVGHIETYWSEEDMFARMRDSDFDPATTVLTEGGPSGSLLVDENHSVIGHARIVEYSTTRCLVETQSETGAVLVLADAWYPGWRARINGQQAPVFPVYHIFRGVYVPEGINQVEFVYLPGSFLLGGVFSSAGLMLFGLCMWFWQKKLFHI